MSQKFESCLGVYTFCLNKDFKTCVLGFHIASGKENLKSL